MSIRRSALFIGCAFACSMAHARDPRPGEPGWKDVSPPASIGIQGVGHYGSSPFNPPERDDSTFVVDRAPGLDTGCTFRSGGPLVFSIEVGRGFTSDDVARLRSNGLISSKAVIRVPAYDIDFDAVTGYAPERDRVYFNGHPVPEEFLTGGDGIWKLNTFQVPIEWVNFRNPGEQAPGVNEVRVEIDTANSEEVWCTAIDWASLSFEAARPVVMAHGILSDNSVWRDAWMDGLGSKGVPVDDSVNPNMGNLDSIGNNAAKIAAAVDRAKQRWGVDKVNLVTHSKGGLDARHFVEGSDSVETLVQLGTPNAGSPLADLAQGVVLGASGLGGSLIINALAGPAGVQLTQPYMRLYNRMHGYNAEVNYNAMAGVYTPDCTFCVDRLLTSIVGSGDTIVPQPSVHSLAYTSNFIYPSGGQKQDAKHTVMERSSDVFGLMNPLVSRLPRSIAAAAIATGPAVHGESQVGRISAGQVQTRTLLVDEPDISIAMLYPQGTLGLKLVSPSGRRIDPAVAAADPDSDFAEGDILGGRLAGYALRNAERGQWTVEITGVSGADIAYAVTVFNGQAAVTLEPGFARDSIAGGEPLALTATLRDGGAPVLGASAHALVAHPDGRLVGVTLRDDGSNGDAVAGDGIYSALHSDTATAGLYNVLFSAEGDTATGVRFSREAYSLASVSAGHTRLVAVAEQPRDTNGNGFYDELAVTATLDADASGAYRILAVLEDQEGHQQQVSLVRDLVAGRNVTDLVFDGRALYRNRVDGPYALKALRVAQEDDIALLPTLDLSDAYTTSAYRYAQFEHGGIELSGTGTSLGVDSDGDGLYDSMDVAVDVDLVRAGYYSWSAQLSDRTGTRLGFFSGAAYFDAGRNALLFNFPGEPIGRNGEDGPYFVTDLLAFGAGESLVAERAYTAEPYRASQFEGYVLDRTPPTLQLSADPSQLWPPNHRMVPVNVKVEVQDDKDPQPVVTLVAVQSSEPDDGVGDGDTANDIQGADIGTDDRELALRAERSGTGSGRVYTLTYQARDAAGNVTTSTVTVTVPLARR